MCEEAKVEKPLDKDVEETPSIFFTPPAYLQRYNRVREELQRRLEVFPGTSKTVLEVGCAEFGMHPHLKTLDRVEKIIYLDKDADLLGNYKYRLNPLPYESLVPRERPLQVEVYAGCVTKTDARVLKCQPDLFAIIGIEILEHLDVDVEREFVRTLFGEYAPPLIILTTPNSDFNVVLGLEHGKFRHWDHRFELSRAEFLEWCTVVCELFPAYSFVIHGICEGPQGTREKYGHLSQMAVFTKSQSFVTCDEASQIGMPGVGVADHTSEEYVLLERIDYPWKPRPPLQDRFLRELDYVINSVLFNSENLEELWLSEETQIMESMQYFIDRCSHFPDADQLRLSTVRTWVEDRGFSCLEEEDSENVKLIIPVPSPHASDEYEDDTKDSPDRSQFTSCCEGNDEDEWD